VDTLPATFYDLMRSAPSGFDVRFGKRRLRGDDLVCAMSTLAEGLARMGCRPTDLIAIGTRSQVATIVAIGAVSRMGAIGALLGDPMGGSLADTARSLVPAAIVLDHDELMSEDGMAPTVASVDEHLATRLTRFPNAVTGQRDSAATVNRALSRSESSTAIFLFRTSGVTMAPKWVIHTEMSLRAALMSRLSGLARDVAGAELTSEDLEVASAVASAPRAIEIGMHTISGFTQLVHCAALGSPVVFTASSLPREVLRSIGYWQTGGLITTPSMLRIMLRLAERRPLNWDSLRLIGIGGGAADPGLLLQAEKCFGARVIQGYGSTELGGGVLNTRFFDNAVVRTETVGQPLGDVEIEVRRHDGSLAKSDESGELWVKCPTRCAVGYLHGGDEPRVERLQIPRGWYATGDAALCRSNGNCQVLGRLDDKINHHDVSFYPQQVEQALEAHPNVLRALVFFHPDEPQVVAQCELSPLSQVSGAELRLWCRTRVGRYRCPDRFEFRTIPEAANGKVRRSK
jgi:acyl-CoA synthetase (AMP-forming)/AMP-acid ligase II